MTAIRKDHGTKVNQQRAKFFVICENKDDRRPIRMGGWDVEWCDKYTYQGSPFTVDGCASSAVKTYATLKVVHVLKYVSFIKKIICSLL